MELSECWSIYDVGLQGQVAFLVVLRTLGLFNLGLGAFTRGSPTSNLPHLKGN